MLPLDIIGVQRSLSTAQAIPVFGIAVSPVKAAVSIVQIIVGLAGTIIFGVGVLLTNREAFGFGTVISFGISLAGATSLVYSIGNILTLGILGYKLEKERDKSTATVTN